MNAATFTAAVLLLGTIPHDAIVRDRACCLEIDHFCDADDAREVFTQLVVWETCRGKERIIDWRLVKRTDGKPNLEVRRDYTAGGYVAMWQDGEVLREVRAPCFRERWTQHDVELKDREHHPLNSRRKLSDGREAIVE
jgi:hypothetical protein